jgi:hypothetical protein
MEQVRAWSSKQTDVGRKIVIAACVIMGLMLLFPPKMVVSRNPLLDQTHTEYVGYHFIFDDPAAEDKKNARLLLGDEVDKYISSQIEWGKLLIQLIIVGGAAFGLTRYMKTAQS